MSQYIPLDDLVLNAIPKTEEVGQPFVNSYGYATDEFVRSDLNVQFLGCSWTQGGNEESTNSFAGTVCRLLSERYGVSVSNWNMGLGGRSVDYITRTLLCSLDALRPDIVFMVFPGLDRLEYFRADGKRIKYQIDWVNEKRDNGRNWRAASAVMRECISHLNELASPYDSTVRFVKDYKLIELLLDSKKTMWGYSMVPPSHVVEPIYELMEAGWLDMSHYLGTPFEKLPKELDTTYDDGHPGIQSHQRFGNQVFDWIVGKYDRQIQEILSARTRMSGHNPCDLLR